VKRTLLFVLAMAAVAAAACSSSQDAGADAVAVPGVSRDATPAQAPTDNLWLLAFASNLSDSTGASCRYADASGCDIYTVVYDATTGDVSDLRKVAGTAGVGDWFPSLSPDGCWVAHNADSGNNRSAATVTHLATGTTTRVADASRFPDWAPDGASIAWASNAPGAQDLLVAPATADCAKGELTLGARTLVTHESGGSKSGDPDFFPDGRSLSFHIDPGKTTPAQSAVINIDGSGLQPITPNNGMGHTAVRPDGMAIAASSSQAPVIVLIERSGDGWAAPRTILRAGTPASYASYDPRYASCSNIIFYYPAWLDSDHLVYGVGCGESGTPTFTHLFMTDVSTPGATETVDLGSMVEDLAGVAGKDFVTASAIPLPAGYQRGGGSTVAPPTDDGIVYLSFVTHNEEPNIRQPEYLGDQAFYLENREILRQLVELFTARGVAYDFQTDWNFLQAVARYDTPAVMASTGGMNIIQWMASKGVSIDPHAHESKYSYADVAAIIRSLGVEPSGVVGGFLYEPVADADWERFQDGTMRSTAFPSQTWTPTTLWGAATMLHQGNDDLASGVWRPLDAAHFSIDDPNSDLAYIGNCTSSVEGVEALVDDLESGAAPAGGFYTASIFLPQGQFDENTVARAAAMLDRLSDEVAAGSVVFKTLPEVAELWEEDYGAEPSRYVCR